MIINQIHVYSYHFKLTSATAAHQKTPTQNMKKSEDNTDDRKRQGQHKRQAQIWTDMDKTNKSVCIAPAIQTGI